MDAFSPSRSVFIASAFSMAATVNSSEGAAAAQPLDAPTASESVVVPFRFDHAAFQAVLDRPFPHRQLAVPSSYADATAAMGEFQRAIAAYSDPNGFAAGPYSLHCAAVLYRGFSIFMVLDDAMFAKYPIGLMSDEEMRPNDTRYRAVWTAMRYNPGSKYLRSLIDQGVSFFVCNNHLSYLAGVIAQRTRNSSDAVAPNLVREIHDELAAHFLPSTMLVPAGVAAIIAAQEAHFTYLP